MKRHAKMVMAILVGLTMIIGITAYASAGEKSITIGMANLALGDYFTGMRNAVVKAGEDRGWNVIATNADGDDAKLVSDVENFIAQKVDGIIFGPTGHNTEFIRSLAARIPMIQVDRYLPDLQSDAVVVDNEGGAYQAVKLLTQRGHRRIGLVGCSIVISTPI